MRRGPFPALTKQKAGKLEAADGGTIYIPEVTSLNEAVQLKLLHFMQYKSVTRVGQDPRKPSRTLDVRLLVATNESLEDAVREGRMRKDFFHRINGVKLRVVPLRERTEDIEPLARYFLRRNARRSFKEEIELAPEVINAFKAYGWPGNIRELENWIRNAIAYSGNAVLTLNDFPHFAEPKSKRDECRVCMATRFQTLPEYQDAVTRFKQAYFFEVLRRANNRTSQAASIAGMTTQGLGRILKALKIKDE